MSFPRSKVALLAGLLAVNPGGALPARAADTGDPKPTPPAHAEEGFTRESLDSLGRPEPTPAPSGPIVSQRVATAHVVAPRAARSQVDSKDFPARSKASTPIVHRVRIHSGAKREEAHIVVAKSRSPRRNPVVSFVYWWNGFVIRTFHTKNGTVLLNRIGAKT